MVKLTGLFSIVLLIGSTVSICAQDNQAKVEEVRSYTVVDEGCLNEVIRQCLREQIGLILVPPEFDGPTS